MTQTKICPCIVPFSFLNVLSAEARYTSKASRASSDVDFFLAEVEVTVADPSSRPHSRPESLSGDYFHRCCLRIKPLGRVQPAEFGVPPLPLGLVQPAAVVPPLPLGRVQPAVVDVPPLSLGLSSRRQSVCPFCRWDWSSRRPVCLLCCCGIIICWHGSCVLKLKNEERSCSVLNYQ